MSDFFLITLNSQTPRITTKEQKKGKYSKKRGQNGVLMNFNIFNLLI